MGRNVSVAVRELCLNLPDVTEKESHGMATFQARGKTFAYYTINHHGDGHVALWLEANPGSQALYTEMEPEHYFVPPFVGTKGWLGVELNRGISWKGVTQRVVEAYEKTVPASLSKGITELTKVAPPSENLTPQEIDPLLAARPKKFIQKLSKLCLALPETSTARQFGNPVFKAGKKTFVCIHRYEQRLCIQVWVGIEQQSFLTDDPRYRIPAYVGHNGWIDLDVEGGEDWSEIGNLIDNSYRHFALKRMLTQMDLA